MDARALAKAQSRLRVAQRAVADLRSSNDYHDFSDHWYVFLHAAKAIYTTLEQGAKATAQARQWFGAKNQDRKNDGLLRYITEARNDDEHGIEAVTEYVPGSAKLGVNRPGSSRAMVDQFGNRFSDPIGPDATVYNIPNLTDPSQIPQLHALDGKPIFNEVTTPKVKLINVRDRSGRTYAPPSNHLGQAILDPEPVIVADLTVNYLKVLLEEAEGFRMP